MNYYNAEDLKKLQKVELSILLNFDEVCQLLGLTYWLDGGSALGAIRHGGFIPWDDDVDVGMMRDDYDSFKEKAPAILAKKGLFLQDIGTDQYTAFNYIKIRKDNTAFVEYCNRKSKMHKGIYIDVFPYDKIPKEQQQKIRYLKSIKKWQLFWDVHQTPDISEQPSTIKGYIIASLRRIAYYIFRIIPMSVISNKMNLLCRKYYTLSDSFVGYVCSDKCYYTDFRWNDFLPVVYVQFEGNQLPVPANVDGFLKKCYGEYTILPDKSKQYGHRPYFFSFDCDNDTFR